MLSNVFMKTLYDKRLFLLGWSLGVIALLALTAAFFPSMQSAALDQLFKAIPPSMKTMIGDLSDYSTFPGYLGSAVFGLRAQMLFVPMAIILGYSLSVTEESGGKLYQLLAQPISRLRVLLEKFFAGLFISAVVIAVSILSIVVVSLLINEPVPQEMLMRVYVMSVLFTWAVFALTYALGKATGRKSIALMIPVVWVMFSLLVDAFASQIEWLKNTEYASLFHYYRTAELVHNDINWANALTLVVVTVLPILIALLVFPNRDLREDQ